jgi:hypothetical protein
MRIWHFRLSVLVATTSIYIMVPEEFHPTPGRTQEWLRHYDQTDGPRDNTLPTLLLTSVHHREHTYQRSDETLQDLINLRSIY